VSCLRSAHWDEIPLLDKGGRRVAGVVRRGDGIAQDNFPDHPIRMVNPYSPGSVADVFGRIVAHNMAEQWNGSSIIIESKSGANGSIAAEDVARSAPDGYTRLLVTVFFSASPSLYNSLRWDPVRDFIPIGQICRAPNFFVVPSSLPAKNVAEYVALAKAKPGALNYSHPGKGSTGHLGFELFKRLAGIDVTGIGYRGYPQMVPDLASGLINFDLPVRQPGAGAGANRHDPDHRHHQRWPHQIFPRRADHGRAGRLWRGAGNAVVRHRGAGGNAAAGHRSDQQRRWRWRFRRQMCSKGSTSPDASRRARRSGSSAMSSRPMSRGGPGWSRRPALPRIDAVFR
jgi:hypothetical protein